MVMIRDGGSVKGGRGKGGLIYCRELGEVQCKESQRQGPDLNGRRWGWGRWGHCLHLGLKYEKQKILCSKKQTNKQKKAQEEWGIKFCAPARSVLTPVQALLDGPLHLPSSWVPLSLSLPLWHSLSFSPPPLAASCQSSWFTPPCLGLSESCERLLFRSVTADWEQLTQGQGGEERVRVTLSSASQEPYLHSS